MKSIVILFCRSDLNSAHWMTEIEGLGAIVRLMKYHSDIVLPDINELIHALNHECKNKQYNLEKYSLEQVILVLSLIQKV